MRTVMPMGARIFVLLDNPVSDLEAQARAAGLHIVLEEQNIPKPTSGRVIALGTDPLVHESLRIGDNVIFHRHSGTNVVVEGKELRCLELHEVISVIRDEATPPRPS